MRETPKNQEEEFEDIVKNSQLFRRRVRTAAFRLEHLDTLFEQVDAL